MDPGEFLPSGAVLARSFGLSQRTVCTVMEPFAREGRIERIPGKGTRIPGQANIEVPAPSPALSAEDSIVRTIKRDIFNGTLKTGDPLPPRKRFRLQFGVESRAVSRAYEQLVRENLVINIGRRFWVGDFSTLMKTGMSRDMFFFDCRGAGWDELFGDEIYGDMYRKAEHIVTTRGFRVFYRGFESFESLMERWHGRKEFPHGLLLAGMTSREAYRDFRLVDHLVRRYFGRRTVRRPPSMVIAGPTSYREMTPSVKALAGTSPTTIARETARFLVNGRHTRACFFFNEERLGNRRFFDHVRLRAEVCHRYEGFDLRYVVKTEGKPDMESFLERLQAHYPGTGLEYLHRCLDKYGPVPLERFLNEVSLVERFDEAFDTRGGRDVWLFSNDADAVEALTWCAANGIRVPEDCGLISFENAPAYLQHGITSVILDKETIGYNLAHALLDDIPVERTSQGYLRMKALVLERGTT